MVISPDTNRPVCVEVVLEPPNAATNPKDRLHVKHVSLHCVDLVCHIVKRVLIGYITREINTPYTTIGVKGTNTSSRSHPLSKSWHCV